jgi:sec-independent protein translocase protein TatA
MGIGGISIWQLLIILAIVILIFGSKRLKSLGADLGHAIKGYKKAVNNEDKQQQSDNEQKTKSSH